MALAIPVQAGLALPTKMLVLCPAIPARPPPESLTARRGQMRQSPILIVPVISAMALIQAVLRAVLRITTVPRVTIAMELIANSKSIKAKSVREMKCAVPEIHA